MRYLFILLSLFLIPFSAHAQNVEDAPLEDVPAITQPADHAANRAKPPSQTATPAPAAPIATESGGAEEAPPATDGAPGLFDFSASFATPFMRPALAAGLLAALLCGTLGIYVVLRRVVFVGVALAELSSAGIALGLLLGFAPIVGALLAMGIGVVLFSFHPASRRLPRDAFVGIVYLLASALGILMIAKSAQGESFMLKLLQGDVLTVDATAIWLLVGALAIIGALHLAFAKEFILVSFDREAAATLGLRAGMWDFLLMLSIGAAIAVSIHAAGVLFTSAMLVLPAATALLLARSLRTAWILAPIFATVPVILGLHLSLVADVPASAMIVVLMFASFLVALAARRG